MNTGVGAKSVIEAGHVSHVSPMFHRQQVKQEAGGSAVYVRKNNNSLSSFTYSPIPARATPARAYMRVCVRGGGEGGKEANRYFLPIWRPRARGNSSQSRQSFICLSDLAGRRPGPPQDAIRATLGDRRPPGRIVGTPWAPRRHGWRSWRPGGRFVRDCVGWMRCVLTWRSRDER